MASDEESTPIPRTEIREILVYRLRNLVLWDRASILSDGTYSVAFDRLIDTIMECLITDISPLMRPERKVANGQ